MEDYDKFLLNRLSHVRKSKEEEEDQSKPPSSSSLIRFYGRPILPPMLSGKQREEMQHHRDEMQKAVDRRKSKEHPRMAYVETILHSVQLRKTPTLDELLQEMEISIQPSYSHNFNSDSGPQSNIFLVKKDSLSPPPVKANDGVSLPPLTSTTYSAFFTSDAAPQQSYHKGCLIDQLDSQRRSQPSSFNDASHQSLSSGYVTNENVENTTSVSETIDAGSKSHGFDSSEGVFNMGNFFLHNTSDTVTKMPDIISHPPINGEELERSGPQTSCCSNLFGVKDNCCTSYQEDSVISDHLQGEKSESSHLDSVVHGDNIPSATILDNDKDGNTNQSEESVTLSEKSGFSDNPDISQTLSSHQYPTKELNFQHDPKEPKPVHNQVDEADPMPSKEPYRLSLQALLKKSQEYRRHQRMLRNQAKNTKIQERTQEQPREGVEEQSLSDKENDEFPYKGTVTAEGKKTKERKGTLIPSVETSTKKSWENEKMIDDEFIAKRMNVKSESTHFTGDLNTMKLTSVEETLKTNQLNNSQDAITNPKQSSAFIQLQPTPAETSFVQDSFYLTTGSTAFHKGVRKYHAVPIPNICRSPILFKNKGSIKDGQAADQTETSEKKFIFSTGLNEDYMVKEVNPEHQTCHMATPSTVDLMVEGDVASVLAKSSQQIDQLESDMISDLESTEKENLDNQCQTQRNTQSELSFNSIKNSEQIITDRHMQLVERDCVYWEDRTKDDDDHAEHREWLRNLPSNNSKNIHEDKGAELSLRDTDEASLTVQEKGTEAVGELRLIKMSGTENGKEKDMGKEGIPKSYASHGGCRKQHPPAKSVFSVAQWMRIPDVFRNVPSDTTSPSVLSDTSNHPVERRNEMAVEGHVSTCSPSLNQSYDVDTPSGLWLHEGLGSDLSSHGHFVQQKHLTPESGSEGQGGVSKVKRKLLMYMAEKTQEKSPDNSRGAGDTVVTPNSSTPRAAVCCCRAHGSQEDKQEQLKQAHAAQIRALQDKHRKQQELLQAMAARYHLLESASFSSSMSSSHLGDTLTFSALCQPSSPLSQFCRPLLAAVVKGFLTRRLLRTERVAQLVRTIRDTQVFLQAFQQQQSPGREFCSRQDLLLQKRVTLQLRAARYEVYDIFFILSARERMQIISWDREVARERKFRQQTGHDGQPRRKTSLSAATQKSLKRKREMMIQKKAAERHRGVIKRTGQKTGFSLVQPQETKRGQFRANPQRVPKSNFSTRPR